MPIKAVIERDPIDYSRFEADMSTALFAGGTDVQRFLSTMPAKKKKILGGSLLGGFYTLKQKRYVHWAADMGIIDIPYMRQADLARSWTVAPVQQIGSSLSVEIYSDPSIAPYGRLVQDPSVRPEMHEDWPSPDLAKEKLEEQVVSRLRDVGRRYGFA